MDKKTFKWMGLTFLVTWTFVLLYRLYGKQEASQILLGAVVLWIPGTSALLYAQKHHLKLFTRPNRFCFLSTLLAVVIGGLTLGVSLLWGEFKGIQKFVESFPFQWILMILGAGLSLNMIITVGGELMWRGVLVERLKHLQLWEASLMIGGISALWQVPVILILGYNNLSHLELEILMMVGIVIMITPLLIFLRIKGKSVFVPAVLYGTLNALEPVSVVFFKEPNLLLIGTQGLAGIIVVGCISVGLCIRYKNMPMTGLEPEPYC